MSPVADGNKTSALNPSALRLYSKAHDTKLCKLHLCLSAASTFSTFQRSLRTIYRCLYGQQSGLLPQNQADAPGVPTLRVWLIEALAQFHLADPLLCDLQKEQNGHLF